LNIAAPFKFQDYVVGFKYALGDLKKAPEALFAKRSFETGGDGKVNVDTEYNLIENTLNVAAKWTSDHFGLSLAADGDNKQRLRNVEVSKTMPLRDNQLSLSAAYDLLLKKISSSANIKADQTSVDLKYDSEDRDPVLSVSRSLDANNEISPSIALRSGEMSYGYKRNWNGGSLAGKLFPGDKVALEWKDNGAQGTWVTGVEVPLQDRSNTKVSFSREWNY